MNTLDRLKELNAGNEWDFNDLGFLVNALPDLIELAEAVKLYKEMAYENHANNYARMCAALAKLEAPHD